MHSYNYIDSHIAMYISTLVHVRTCARVYYLMYGSTDNHTALAKISVMTNKIIVVLSISYYNPANLCKQCIIIQ